MRSRLVVALALALASARVHAAPAKPTAPTVPAKPTMSGFPAHDPVREVTLFGKVRPGDAPAVATATTRGTWTADGGRLLPLFAAPPAEQLWFPKGPPAHLGDGLVRARVELGAGADVSILLRQRYQGDPPSVLSGYGLSLEGDVVRFHRWDRGMVLPMGPEAKLPAKPGRAPRGSVEVVVVMVGPQLLANVYDGETLEHLASAAVHDTTYAFGCLGVRVGPAHDPKAAVTLLSAMDAAKHAATTHRRGKGPLYGVMPPSDRTPFGNTRYAWIPAAATKRLPKDLRGAVIPRTGVGADERAVLFVDTVGYERLRRSAVDVLAIDSNVPWSAFDAPFRRRATEAPARRGRGFVLDDSYKDPALVEQLLRAYHERYPAITRLVEVGRTHQGRTIWGLAISDADADADEPAVLFNGAHHGSELLSIEYVLDAIDTLLAEYHRDPQVTAWIDGLEIWCVPLVNVDGNHMFVHESRFAIRKNAFDGDRDGVADPFEGVDLNRNYPFGWGEEGSSALPMHKWYRGPGPGSEPETRAMMALAEAERFAAVLSFHTYGTDVYSSYVVPTKRDTKPDVSKSIGQHIAAAAPEQPNARSYAVRKGPYPVAGSDQDWYLHEHGTIAFVVEGSHHNPDPEVRNEAVAATRPLWRWRALLDRVHRGPWIGGHVRDAAGKPVAATVMVAEIQTFEGERWTTRARDGRFDRAVTKPGTYTLVVQAEGRSKIERTVTVGTRRVDVDIVLPGG
jgi:hypothetical protein